MSTFTQDPRGLGAKKIRLNDTFSFGCCGCGNCCRGRNNLANHTDIFLSGADVQRIASYLNLPVTQLIEKYLEKFLDEDLGLMVCKLRIRPSGSCRFLTQGKCSIYPARPRTCALYPIARGLMFHSEGTKGKFIYDCDRYLLNDSSVSGYQCDQSASYTVEDWLNRNGVPISDTEDRQWYHKLLTLSFRTKKLQAPKSELIRQAFSQLYIDWTPENENQ